MPHAWAPRALALALACVPALASAASPPESSSAADVARQQGEVKRIEAEFVARVAAIVGVQEGRVRALLPREPRIAQRGPWLAQVIAKEIRPLSEREVSAIVDADLRRRRALAGTR